VGGRPLGIPSPLLNPHSTNVRLETVRAPAYMHEHTRTDVPEGGRTHMTYKLPKG
jgi:hypothetical protein